GSFLYCGPYGGEAYHVEFNGVFTNTVPTDAYRGAGRPEATYAVERTIEALARKVGKDPVEIRRLNFIPAFTEPTPSPGGLNLDSGDYEAALDKALHLVGYDLVVSPDDVEVLCGDTQLAPLGMDTYGSRSLAVGGVAVHRAAQKVVSKIKKIAAHELEVSEEDLEYERGRFSVKGAPDRA